MTRRLSPRRFPLVAVTTLTISLGLPVLSTRVLAQNPAPGTLDQSFTIDRVRNPSFLPTQTNFTPFALSLQPGQDPVQTTIPSIREIPASRTKLIVGGDAAVVDRLFLTKTVRAATTYDANGVPVTTYGSPYFPGDFDPIFFTAPSSANGIGNDNRITYSLFVNADGGVLVGGLFGQTALIGSIFDNDQDKNIVLLNFNGDPEISFAADGTPSQGPFNTNLGAGANDSVLAILRRSTVAPGENDGRLLLGGQFIRFNKQDRGRVVQLLPDGTSDVNFNANLGSGANGIVFSLAEAFGPGVDAFGVGFFGINGQIYVCGDYDRFNNKGPGKLVRLNADGTVDTNFAPKIVGRAISVAAQPDGKVLVGGDLDSVNGSAVRNIARLNYDGTLDSVFLANATVTMSSPSGIPPTSVYVMRVQPDGRILVGGNFLNIDGTLRRYLGRLNADGTLDTTFNANGLLPDPNNTNTNVTQIISNAIQSIVTVARDPSLGIATDVIYSQTRADRKQVSGDNGFFPNPVRRLFGDNVTPDVTAFPVGAPIVRVGAEGPTATIGDLTVRPDLVGQSNPNPGTPGLFRVTREGDVTNDLTVRLKVVGTPAMTDFNVTYDVRQLVFTPVTTTNDSGVATTVINTTASARFNGPRFDIVIPAGQSSVDLIVEGLTNGQTPGVGEPLTLKIKASADGSYSFRADQRSAIVTLFPNTL